MRLSFRILEDILSFSILTSSKCFFSVSVVKIFFLLNLFYSVICQTDTVPSVVNIEHQPSIKNHSSFTLISKISSSDFIAPLPHVSAESRQSSHIFSNQTGLNSTEHAITVSLNASTRKTAIVPAGSAETFSNVSTRTVLNSTEFAQTVSLHDTFLLTSSVNELRFWSINCSIHNSKPLLTNSSRSSSVKHGFSGMAIWQRNSSSYEIIWFDVLENKFHHASLYRPYTSDCNNLLGIEFNQTMTFSSKQSLHFEKNKEKMVKLKIDNLEQLLFVSNLLQNRIDIYRLDNVSSSNNELFYISSLETIHPIDMALDEKAKTIFWIEDWKRICHLKYQLHSDFLTGNFSNNKFCSNDLAREFNQNPPQALTLDTANREVIWASKYGQLFRNSYDIHDNKSVKLFQTDYSVYGLVFWDNKLYLNNPNEVHVVDLSRNISKVVLIEANVIFDLLLYNFTHVNQSFDGPISTTTAEPITTISNVQSMTNEYNSKINDDITTNNVPNSPTSFVNLGFWILIIFLILVSLVALHFAIFVFRKSYGDISSPFRRYVVDPYNNVMSRVKNSTGFVRRHDNLATMESANEDRVRLCNEHDEPTESASNTIVNTENYFIRNANRSYFQQNLRTTSHVPSATDDIEDILGSNGPMHTYGRTRIVQANCLACRDPDICQDKGLCMATYRVH